MISRRLLRVKVLQILYAHCKVEGKTYRQSENDLVHSIHKSFELYHQLLLLIIEVRRYMESRMEMARQKKRPTHEDLHPNTRFIDNDVINQLEANHDLNRFLKKSGLSWVNYPELIRILNEQITEYEHFINYMAADSASYSDDKKLVINIYQDVFMNSEALYQSLEDQSIFWLDDVDYVCNMVIKTIKGFTKGQPENHPLLPMFRDAADMDFARLLLRKSVINYEEYIDYIEEAARNWDLDRIAEIDRIIMTLAISEAVEFDSIPTKVTMNEYIEIAKSFSTRKSSKFINGILDSIFNKLKAEKKIIKKGRGLIGEVETPGLQE